MRFGDNVVKENDANMRVQNYELREVAELSWNSASELIRVEFPDDKIVMIRKSQGERCESARTMWRAA